MISLYVIWFSIKVAILLNAYNDVFDKPLITICNGNKDKGVVIKMFTLLYFYCIDNNIKKLHVLKLCILV